MTDLAFSPWLRWLSWPGALWAIPAAVALLVVIYLLRDRFRRLPVSALFLWRDAVAVQRGGRRRRRLVTPLAFFLELLALLLLILAAAGPRWFSSDTPPELVVVLDDSFSMLAGEAESARQQGQRALEELVAAQPFSRLRLVLAAERPRLLAVPETGPAPASPKETLATALRGWRGGAPTANLEAAISLGRQLGSGARLVVVTDHPPPAGALPQGANLAGLPQGADLEWWAFGEPRSNLALINAARGEGSCLFEVANLGNGPASATLTVTVGEEGEGGAIAHREPLELAPGEVRRLRLPLPADAAPTASGEPGKPVLVVAQLPPDALEADNRAVLLPEAGAPVRVALELAEPDRWRALTNALESSGRALLSSPQDPRVDLLITDGEPGPPPAGGEDRWVVRLRSPGPAAAYLGPFVLDRRHPLTEGLELVGVIWAAGPAASPGGAGGDGAAGWPVVQAGDVPLITVAERLGRPWITWNLHPELSTVVRTPAWPALVWNLLHWRAEEAPGVRPVNVRLGSSTRLVIPLPPPAIAATAAAGSDGDGDGVVLVDPEGERHPLPVASRRVRLEPVVPGIHRVEFAGRAALFAANALDAAESDLRSTSTGRWGRFGDGAEGDLARRGRAEFRDGSWIALLLALAVLLVQGWLYLASRREGRQAVTAASGGRP